MSYAKVRAILDAATPGPWMPDPIGQMESEVWAPEDDGYVYVAQATYRDGVEDARAIVVAHNLAPELLAVAERLGSRSTHREGCHPSEGIHESDCLADRAALDALYAKMRETL